MTKFDDAIRRKQNPESPYRIVDIDLDCTFPYCFNACDEVRYHYLDNALVGICADGHKSLVENFDLPL